MQASLEDRFDPLGEARLAVLKIDRKTLELVLEGEPPEERVRTIRSWAVARAHRRHVQRVLRQSGADEEMTRLKSALDEAEARRREAYAALRAAHQNAVSGGEDYERAKASCDAAAEAVHEAERAVLRRHLEMDGVADVDPRTHTEGEPHLQLVYAEIDKLVAAEVPDRHW